MQDIKQFNERFLVELHRAASSDPRAACRSFGIERGLADIIAEACESNLIRLATEDSLLVRQNFCSSIVASSSVTTFVVSPSSMEPMSTIQSLNYEYLMLVRHIAARSVREAMLRTGVEYAAAERMTKLTTRDVYELVRPSECMIGKCHLTPKAVKTATSEFGLPAYISMLSMRSRGEPCLR